MFVGNGFDIHKHSVDASLILGGIEVEGAGFEAHSDGDILLHSLCDALLGSVAKKDLGYYFPSNESTPKDISSVEMLDKVLEIIEIDKLVINNIDITILSQIINISKISDQKFFKQLCPKVNCSAIFKTNPTDRGMCCTFNALAAEEIYR